jgi:hypothetical protein
MPEFDSTVEYRVLEEFPDYAVGSDGSVWSQKVPGRKQLGKWRQLQTTQRHTGDMSQDYPCVTLSPSGRQVCRHVHTLVLTAFVGPRPFGYEACHGNRDIRDNRLANLRWGTPTDNRGDSIAHGTWPHGESHGNAKLCDADVVDILQRAATGDTLSQIARDLRVSRPTIQRVVQGKSWRHVPRATR